MTDKNFFWNHKKRYNDFPTYFKNKFLERVQKVSIDAGFTCPNRDGLKGKGGCTYCNNKTFKPTYCNLENSVTNQIQKGVDFFAKKYDAMKFLAYFQAYTNTYAPLEDLKRLYEEALQHPKIVGLVISTRPDSIDEELLDYLSELSKGAYVMVEFGVESHLDKSLELINRGHSFADSVWALEQTEKRGINNCAHMILGLPGENHSDWLEQAKIISKLPVKNLKLHQLQIHKGTILEKQYRERPDSFFLFSAEEYVELVVDYLELLSPQIIVERFISQAPPDMLLAPKWGLKNFEFVAKVEKRLKERDTWQGRLYK
ncbi:TIGR01212 family radical SAM protein [Maribellus comscasis]|uniref:TIGR01212 family radical SAM protein n=1 Tax=Maribellus comscasis TaxID=2681766 RepID=A0A6I6JSI8_9BACT|nr:TIGR01212 family radical SAM protein [Maribellus comscasis]QGY46025.1 TIGR01212 family radical SAM protein [Maribellus comscasis]